MFPFSDCADVAAPLIASPFAQALGSFDPASGNATVLDRSVLEQAISELLVEIDPLMIHASNGVRSSAPPSSR